LLLRVVIPWMLLRSCYFLDVIDELLFPGFY
jgi:hypothetical protein